MLLELFGESGGAARMRNLAAEHRIEEAKAMHAENLRRDADAELDAWCDEYHLTAEERETFEDYLNSKTEADGMMLADGELEQLLSEYEQDRRSEEVDSQYSADGTGYGSAGGAGQVRGQSAGEEYGANRQEQYAEGREAAEAVAAVSDTDVSGGESRGSGDVGPLTAEDAGVLIGLMEAHADEDPAISLTPETWIQSFGLNNSLQTPIGSVKMGENQYEKLVNKNRTKEFGMVVRTLSDPDVVFVEPSKAKEGHQTERPYSYIFVKTFKKEGQKVRYYASVTVFADGMEVSVSSHHMNGNAVRKRMMNGT